VVFTPHGQGGMRCELYASNQRSGTPRPRNKRVVALTRSLSRRAGRGFRAVVSAPVQGTLRAVGHCRIRRNAHARDGSREGPRLDRLRIFTRNDGSLLFVKRNPALVNAPRRDQHVVVTR